MAILLRHGADPNIVDSRRNTALHYAVYSGNTSIAGRLLEHNADIESKTKVKITQFYFLYTFDNDT